MEETLTLHLAAAREAAGGKVENIVKALLAAGADPHQTDANGETAFNIAAPASPVAGRLMTYQWLLDAMAGKGQKGLNDFSGSHGSTLMQYIAKWARDDEVEAWIRMGMEKGMKIDVPNKSGWTPLIAAAAMGQVGAVRVLKKLYSPAALNLRTTEAYTAHYTGCDVSYAAGLDAAGVVKERYLRDSGSVRERFKMCMDIIQDD